MTQFKSLTQSWLFLAGVVSVSLFCAAAAENNLKFCNAVQNKVGFIRYPLGTIGAWSTAAGETADVITRAPRIYPCVGALALKPEKDDWRAAVRGDPATLTIDYLATKPSGASTTALTVSPHVSVFKVTFPSPGASNYLVFDFRKVTVDSWARLYKWTSRTVSRVNERTLHAAIGEPGKKGAFYVIRFSVPCASSGMLDSTGAVAGDAVGKTGTEPVMFARFDAPAVTVAVAESFTGLDKAEQFLAAEYTGFESVQERCRSAWSEVLQRVELEGSETSKRMAYTALYTIYANIIDGSDGSHYSGACARPRSVASSAYWQFIGGYQSCCWDNVRATYPFLATVYPEVMADVLNTYLARYQVDGCMDGDACLFAGPSGHNNIRFSPALVAQGYYGGVRADFGRLYAALHNNFHNEAYVGATLWPLGRLTQPAAGGFACSRTLEYTTGAHAMALLAGINNDPQAVTHYLSLSQAYTNLWDSTNRLFRLRNADGTWGPIENSKMTWNSNPQGLFEGTSKDWMFAVPHDPFGLINLPGQQEFVHRVVDYCTQDAWFNDYQEIYPYMLYYAGAPNEAQRLLRRVWVPLFEQAVMYEGVRPRVPHNGWQTHYTGSSGWLLCSMLGLYPGSAPVGQFIISSPSIEKAIVHNGGKEIRVESRNNDGDNIYLRSIKVDGKVYPAYMIPARRLAAGARIELEMGSDPALGLGDLYVGASEGFILNAELVSAAQLKCTVAAPVGDATTLIHSRTRPSQVIVNGEANAAWDYNAAKQAVAIRSSGTATIEVRAD